MPLILLDQMVLKLPSWMRWTRMRSQWWRKNPCLMIMVVGKDMRSAPKTQQVFLEFEDPADLRSPGLKRLGSKVYLALDIVVFFSTSSTLVFGPWSCRCAWCYLHTPAGVKPCKWFGNQQQWQPATWQSISFFAGIHSTPVDWRWHCSNNSKTPSLYYQIYHIKPLDVQMALGQGDSLELYHILHLFLSSCSSNHSGF